MVPTEEAYNRLIAKGEAAAVVALSMLVLQCGLRINDARNITPADVLPNLDIVVNQSKGSRQLIVTPIYMRDWWAAYRYSGRNIFQLYSYDFFRRLFIRHGIIIVTPAGKNNKVTHSGRTAKAREIYAATNSLTAAAAALGHKQTSSTMYYLNNEQRRAEQRRGLLTTPQGTLAHMHITKKGILFFRDYKKNNA